MAGKQDCILLRHACTFVADPSFRANRQSESDMRFIYCASVISWLLNDWSFVNLPLALDYIASSHVMSLDIIAALRTNTLCLLEL